MKMRKKVTLVVKIDSEVDKELRELIARKYSTYRKGYLSEEVEQALRNWLQLHGSHGTGAQTDATYTSNLIRKVFTSVKIWLETEMLMDVNPGAVVSGELIRRAISAVRGSDERTIRKWMKTFVEHGLIRNVGGDAWEVS